MRGTQQDHAICTLSEVLRTHAAMHTRVLDTTRAASVPRGEEGQVERRSTYVLATGRLVSVLFRVKRKREKPRKISYQNSPRRRKKRDSRRSPNSLRFSLLWVLRMYSVYST